jgi:hypothetical protein
MDTPDTIAICSPASWNEDAAPPGQPQLPGKPEGGKKDISIEEDECPVEATSVQSGLDYILRRTSAGIVDVNPDAAIARVDGFEMFAESFFGKPFDHDLGGGPGTAWSLFFRIASRHGATVRSGE